MKEPNVNDARVPEGPNSRRISSRVPVEFSVRVWDGEALLSGQTRDLSLRGFFFETEASIPLGTRCRVELELGLGDRIERVELEAKAARQDENGIGFEIVELEGTESYALLRNVLLYNAREFGDMERELQRFVGINPRLEEGTDAS